MAAKIERPNLLSALRVFGQVAQDSKQTRMRAGSRGSDGEILDQFARAHSRLLEQLAEVSATTLRARSASEDAYARLLERAQKLSHQQAG